MVIFLILLVCATCFSLYKCFLDTYHFEYYVFMCIVCCVLCTVVFICCYAQDNGNMPRIVPSTYDIIQKTDNELSILIKEENEKPYIRTYRDAGTYNSVVNGNGTVNILYYQNKFGIETYSLRKFDFLKKEQ